MLRYTAGIMVKNQSCHAVLMQHNQNKLVLCDVIECNDQNPVESLLEIKKYLPKRCQIILGISHQQVLLQMVSVDAILTDSEIMCYLQSQLSTVNHFYVDYETLFVRNNKRHIRVVSVHEQCINQIRKLCKESKVTIHVIDVDVLALNRLIIISNKNKHQLIISEQDSGYLLVFSHDGALVFYHFVSRHEISLLTQYIMQSCEISNKAKTELIIISNSQNELIKPFETYRINSSQFLQNIMDMQQVKTALRLEVVGLSLWQHQL